MTVQAGEFGDGISVPKLRLQGFSDFSFIMGGDEENHHDTSGAFHMGDLDLFITSHLGDDFSVLSELMFAFGHEMHSGLAVERLQLLYAPTDFFQLKVGRYHTALGYWNETYHHGQWLQTTIDRPFAFQFEDHGGYLPLHSVGIQAMGTIFLSNLDLSYSMGVSNGRGPAVHQITNTEDPNLAKAYNLQIEVAPHFLEGLKVGAGAIIDRISMGDVTMAHDDNAMENTQDDAMAETTEAGPEMDEYILFGYLAYVADPFELLIEGSALRHVLEDDSHVDTIGMYAQAAFLVGPLKPYYRFDLVEFGEADPFFGEDAVDCNRHTGGIRWDPMTWVGVKVEYSYTAKEKGIHNHMGTASAAFAF